MARTVGGSRDDLSSSEALDDCVGGLVGRHGEGIDTHLWVLGSLVRRVDAREVLEVAPSGLGVEPFDVAGFGLGKRRVDEDLYEPPLASTLSGQLPFRPERGDERHQNDEASVSASASTSRPSASVLPISTVGPLRDG